MSIKAKMMLAIVLTVVLSIAGVTVMVSREMDKAFINNFETSSKAQLQRMNAFVDSFFANAKSGATLLTRSPLVTENMGTLTSYKHITEPHKPIGANLPPAERALYEELQRIIGSFPAYALVYVGDSKGGFTQAPDDSLGVGFNPVERPWYIAAVQAQKPLVTEAYISDNGDAVCTVAAPVRDKSGSIVGVVGFDIVLETLTKETGSVSIGKTGYVLMLDATGQVISDPKNSGSSIPEKIAGWAKP